MMIRTIEQKEVIRQAYWKLWNAIVTVTHAKDTHTTSASESPPASIYEFDIRCQHPLIGKTICVLDLDALTLCAKFGDEEVVYAFDLEAETWVDSDGEAISCSTLANELVQGTVPVGP